MLVNSVAGEQCVQISSRAPFCVTIVHATLFAYEWMFTWIHNASLILVRPPRCKVDEQAPIGLRRIGNYHPQVRVQACAWNWDDERVSPIHCFKLAKKTSNASESLISWMIDWLSIVRSTASINSSSWIGRDVFANGSG